MEHHTAQLSFSAEARKKENLKIICHRFRSNTISSVDDDSLLGDSLSLVVDANYSPLYIAIANEEVRVQNGYRRYIDIEDGYRRCPLLVLRGLAFELNDSTVIPPLLVQMARNAQNPDAATSSPIPCTAQAWAGREIVNERDVLVVRWWLAYLQLDAKEWELALHTLSLLLDDCEQGLWPEFYIPEVLYQTAVAYFGMDSRELCRVKLERYFTVACPLDRNLADAKVLMLWATKPAIRTLHAMCHQAIVTAGSEKQKEELTNLHETYDLLPTDYDLLPTDSTVPDLQALDRRLKAASSDEMFRNHSWVRVRVTSALGIETQTYDEQIAYEQSNLILGAWEEVGSLGQSHGKSKAQAKAEAVAHRIRDGGTVTVRFLRKKRER